MLEEAKQRTLVFQEKLRQAGVELAILTDESSIAYLAGFWGYLGIEFVLLETYQYTYRA